MSILRRTVESNYTKIPNSLILDTSISPAVKILVIYLFSKPDGWNVYNKTVQKELGINKTDTLSNYWKQAIEAGWVSRKLTQIGGNFEYTLNETPSPMIVDTPPTISGESPSPKRGDYPSPKNGEHSKTEISKTDISKRRKALSPAKIHSGYLIDPPVENLNFDAWKKWVDFRRKCKFTKYKTDATAKKLATIPIADQMTCVDYSIDNQYQGLFPENVKTKQQQSHQRQSNLIDLENTNW